MSTFVTSGRLKPRPPWMISTVVGMQVSSGFQTFTTHLDADKSFTLGRPLYAELSPVTDFREACCRQNENGECNRGGFCNFMHLRLASKEIISSLKAGQRLERRLNGANRTEGAGGWQPPSERNGDPDDSDRKRRRSASPRGRNRLNDKDHAR